VTRVGAAGWVPTSALLRSLTPPTAMLRTRFLRRASAALLTTLGAAVLAPAPVAAQSQTDLVTVTPWTWRTASSLSSINGLLNAGYRMVDLELNTNSAGITSYAGSFVENSGDYGKAWWWYIGVTSTEVNSFLSQNNARLIDVEPFLENGNVRFAVVMISNTGADQATSGWEPFLTGNGLVNWLNNNPTRRIIDVQTYQFLGSERYAITWVENTGSQQSNWWIYANVTPTEVSQLLAQNDARLIDLEHNADPSRMTCIMVPNDGNAWHWFYDVQQQDLGDLARQYGVRMIDIERYENSIGQTRYSFIGRRNENDLTTLANGEMRSRLPVSATSGLYLRRVGAGNTVQAALQESEGFEPASLMKTVHHFVACDRISNGIDSFQNLIIEYQGLNGTCPTGTNPVGRGYRDVLRSMMEQSSNTATEAVRARYGSAFIENRAAAFGATGVQLNHTLGCLCGQPRNVLSLASLYELHDAVADGALGNVRADFYELMVNRPNFGMGSFDTEQILDDELAASTLSSAEEAAFRAELLFAFKQGAYTCIFGFDRDDHRSCGGYMSLPFRVGCEIRAQEYFLGAWVNDATTSSSANDAVGVGVATMFRDQLRAAIDSWESNGCDPFVNYCTAVPNSTGMIGRSGATGTPFISANDVAITASDLPPNQFASLIYSLSAGFTPFAGNGPGNLCIGAPLIRFTSSVQSTGAAGTTSYALDLTALPDNISTTAAQSGQPYYFQWWHRDVSPTGQAISNFTDGLRATFH